MNGQRTKRSVYSVTMHVHARAGAAHLTLHVAHVTHARCVAIWHRVQCTGSLLNSEVKWRRARLVLRWRTAWEDLRVLSAFVVCGLICTFTSFCDVLQMECGHTGKLPVVLVLKGLLEVVTVAWKLENAVQPVRVRFNRVASEIVFQPLHPETGASIHVERVDCNGGLDLHLHFYLRGVTDEIRPHWKLLVDLVRKSLLEVFNVAWKLENAVQPVVVLVSIHLPRRTSTTRRCGRRWWGS